MEGYRILLAFICQCGKRRDCAAREPAETTDTNDTSVYFSGESADAPGERTVSDVRNVNGTSRADCDQHTE